MIVVAGVVVLRPGAVEELRADMLRMIAASRAEAGCRTYSYGLDLVDPTVIRVFEEWESREHLGAHLDTDHLKAWRRRIAEVGVVRRNITAWEATEPVAL